MAIEVRWGSASHAGCVRTHNQDATLCGPDLFVVADGMGGHAAGDVASAIAVSELAALGARQPIREDQVVAGVERANEAILAAASADEARAHMGTTIAGVVLVRRHSSDHVLVFNVGDSRVYRWHDGSLRQVTTDHSVVGELLAAGELSVDAAQSHPQRHVVTRALGVTDTPDIDTWTFDAVTGDRFLVCSDGLTNEVADAELAQVVGQGGGDPQSVAEDLLQAALDRGARDNVSVVLVEITRVEHAGGQGGIDDDTNPKLVIDSLTEEPNSGSVSETDHVAPDTGGVITSVPSFDAQVAR